MTYREPRCELICARCDETATRRAVCCGEPRCDEHEILGDSCFACEQALGRFDRTHMTLRYVGMGMAVLAAVISFDYVLIPWGVSAVFAVLPVVAGALFGDFVLSPRIRKRLVQRRAALHGWQRPKELPAPAPDLHEPRLVRPPRAG